MDCYQHVAMKPQAIYIYQDTMPYSAFTQWVYFTNITPVNQKALTLEGPEATT